MGVASGAVPEACPAPLALVCRGLARRFGERAAVDGVSFSIASGETYGLLGPNGAGKTTTIRLVCGLLRRDAGTVEVAGLSLDDHELEVKAAIGYVPQEIALYPDLTAAENLAFFGRLHRMRGRALRARVAEVLELVGLSERAADWVESFSGGMKRRLNIGVGLLHAPALLILDEPTVGVDPQSRHAILESVAALGRSGMGILYTTHYMEEAQRLCDRVGIIDRGRLVAEGAHRELVSLVEEQDRIELVAQGDLADFCRQVGSLDGVAGASSADGVVQVLTRQGRRVLPRVLELAERQGVVVASAEVAEADLEAVFLHLTGSALRE